MRYQLCILASAVLSASAFGQGLNIDFGTHWGTPSQSYVPTTNLTGLWNSLDAFSANDPPVELMGLDGTPSGVLLSLPLSVTPPTAVYSIAPIVTGDPLALFDDGFGAATEPQRIRLEGLQPQWYEIHVYSTASFLSPTTFIDRSSNLEVTMTLTGGWSSTTPSGLQYGVNYFRHYIKVTEDWLEIDWIATSPTQQGAITGIHLFPIDCYADMDANGTLNIFDYVNFANFYAGSMIIVDCDQNAVLNIFDFVCYGNEYASGCP
ncbi:MAG: hypothetical protein H6815_08245 [Phycisphaeraceae bacterium]|nr:hypothetical protein [Phycisphaerales bacterium]MCB9860430.1 hypothetical protein [Phycisphaeraceae bacterium]